MSVRVRAKLPKGDANGLASWEAKLAENPDIAVPIVALIRADTIENRPHDDDDPEVVKCVFLAIEAPGDSAERDIVDGLIRQTYSARTGKLALPFEEEQVRDLGKGQAE
jgi:hypothetical protein